MPDDIHELNVDKKERIIYVYTAISKRYAQKYEVKDLIKADLVEKI